MAELFIHKTSPASPAAAAGGLTLITTISGQTASATGLIESGKYYTVSVSFSYSWSGTNYGRLTYIIDTNGMSGGTYVIWAGNFNGTVKMIKLSWTVNGGIQFPTTNGIDSITGKLYEIEGWQVV